MGFSDIFVMAFILAIYFVPTVVCIHIKNELGVLLCVNFWIVVLLKCSLIGYVPSGVHKRSQPQYLPLNVLTSVTVINSSGMDYGSTFVNGALSLAWVTIRTSLVTICYDHGHRYRHMLRLKACIEY